MMILAPSMLSADFKVLGEELKTTEENGAKYIHYDVMDGMFVPNLSFGPDILKAFKERNEKKDKSTEQTPAEMPEFSVKVVPYTQEGSNVIGFARIYFEDCFVVSNVTIIQGKESAFVSMPSYKTKDVDENNKPIYRDICYPVTKEFREKLYGVILETHRMEREKRLQDAGEKPVSRQEKMQKEMQKQEEQDKAKKTESKPKKSKGK